MTSFSPLLSSPLTRFLVCLSLSGTVYGGSQSNFAFSNSEPSDPRYIAPWSSKDKWRHRDNWKSYRQIWENYSIITNLKSQAQEYQVALFLHRIGPEALKIYNGLSFGSDNERKWLDKIFEKFYEFTIGEVNETYERYIFNNRS